MYSLKDLISKFPVISSPFVLYYQNGEHTLQQALDISLRSGPNQKKKTKVFYTAIVRYTKRRFTREMNWKQAIGPPSLGEVPWSGKITL